MTITSVDNSQIESLFVVENGKGLRHFVKSATPKAQAILAHGEIIRRKHSDGNVNSSQESTTEGALGALIDMTGGECAVERATEPPFGNRIRWATRVLRYYFRK